MRIYHEYGRIYLHDEKKDVLAYTDYDKDLYEKIKSVKWYESRGYIHSSKLKKSLHRFVMEHWYGEEKVKESKKEGFIVEHFNNEGHDCQISNLYFASSLINTSKAMDYDKLRIEMIRDTAVNFFRDFKTNQYQITLAFNKPRALFDKRTNEYVQVMNMHLLYEDDFIRVLYDAKNILYEFKKNNKLEMSKLYCTKMMYQGPPPMPEGIKDDPAVMHDGKLYLKLDETTYISKIPPREDLYKSNDEE